MTNDKPDCDSVMPNVKAQRRAWLDRFVRLGAQSGTDMIVRCSDLFGSEVFWSVIEQTLDKMGDDMIYNNWGMTHTSSDISAKNQLYEAFERSFSSVFCQTDKQSTSSSKKGRSKSSKSLSRKTSKDRCK